MKQRSASILGVMAAMLLVVMAVHAGPLRERFRVSGNPVLVTQEIRVADQPRSYELYLPPGGGQDKPLVIVLHGTYGTGAKMQNSLGFDTYADSRGFVVAYPDAYRESGGRRTLRWNDGRGVLDSSAKGIDDVAFIAALIDHLARTHGIDTSRVFVTGASNGGIMSYRLGCELGTKIRAIAPVIGNLATPLVTHCRPSPGLSVLSINGDADSFIPLNGGTVCQGVPKRLCEGGEVLSRAESIARFAAIAGCKATPSTRRRTSRENDGTWVEELDYGHCRSGAVIRSVIVHGMGHTWPPRSGQLRASGQGSGNLDATAEIVAFFLSLH